MLESWPLASGALTWLKSGAGASAILLAAGYLFRNSISEFISKRITEKYDKRFAEFSSKLAAQDREHADLRDLAFSGLSRRREILVEKRLNAAENLWKATSILSRARFGVSMMDAVNFEEAAKVAEHNKEAREFFRIIGTSTNPERMLEELRIADPSQTRLYISELAWAFYSAYSGIIFDYHIRQKILEFGAPSSILKDQIFLKELVVATMPEQAGLFDKFDRVFCSIFLDSLEKGIYEEVRKTIAGEVETEQNIEQAHKILAILAAHKEKPRQ